MARPKPRKWTPKNPEKYAGNVDNIITRSSWETKMLNWLDVNPSVIMYNSEEFVIPYISPLDQKQHRYFVDFLAKMRLKDGSEKVYAIEVKPKKEQLPPVHSKNKKLLLERTQTYIVNQAKWEAAKAICNRKGIQFIVINEDDLGIK